MSWDEVHEDAEQLEHSVSKRLIERIDGFLGQPSLIPMGIQFPDKTGLFRNVRSKPWRNAPRARCLISPR